MGVATKAGGGGSVLAVPVQRALRGVQKRYDGASIVLCLPGGDRIRFGLDTPKIKVHFKTWTAIYDTLLRASLGLGEGYVRGEVELEGDLEDALTALGAMYLDRQRAPLEGLLRWTTHRAPPRDEQEIEPRRGDEFHQLYLDKKLQYSCGYFRTPDDSLDVAQEQKITHILRRLALRPGQRLLDIGCGWGHLMFQAAESYGVECLGVTLSDNQAAYIREQAAARRLPVKVRVMSYLELDERIGWDRIVSVDMMCPLGERRIDGFWDKVKALLAPGAVCLLHCIAKMKEAPGADAFIQRHVFPGDGFSALEGMITRAVRCGLNVIDMENLRRHYALTAHHWRRNFLQRYDEIKRSIGLDDPFMRMWEFYLASIAAGFRTGHLNLIQAVLSNGVQDDYPLTREFLGAERSAKGAGGRLEPRLVYLPG